MCDSSFLRTQDRRLESDKPVNPEAAWVGGPWEVVFSFQDWFCFYKEEAKRKRRNNKTEGERKKARERGEILREIGSDSFLKSGLLLSGEGEGGAGGVDGTEAAILPQSVQYRRASANCPLLPFVPNERENNPPPPQKKTWKIQGWFFQDLASLAPVSLKIKENHHASSITTAVKRTRPSWFDG